jgi:RES domain-containing protein
MIVYRLSKAKHSKDLSGKGAELCGARWNSKGKSLLYTSQSRALCTTEIAVHASLGVIPVDYKIITIHLPLVAVAELKSSHLPADWRQFPYSSSTQKLGDKFLAEGKYLVFKVPSASVQGDFNYLINPAHKEFHKIRILKIESFEFDARLFFKKPHNPAIRRTMEH